MYKKQQEIASKLLFYSLSLSLVAFLIATFFCLLACFPSCASHIKHGDIRCEVEPEEVKQGKHKKNPLKITSPLLFHKFLITEQKNNKPEILVFFIEKIVGNNGIYRSEQKAIYEDKGVT